MTALLTDRYKNDLQGVLSCYDRIVITGIKHRMGSVSVKIYDKFGRVLRIETTTTNDVSFFKHHRKVGHKNGTETRELAPLKKSIYSLIDLREIRLGCNRRYLELLSSLNDYSDGQRALQKLTEPKTVQKTTWRGLISLPLLTRRCYELYWTPSLIYTVYVALVKNRIFPNCWIVRYHAR